MHPYLFFSGTCREAMTRYQEILGGQLEIMGLDAVPQADLDQMPGEAPPDMVIHAALVLDDGALLMASDDPTGDGGPMKGFCVNLTYDDPAEATRVFEALAEGGEVGMPLGETFWSPLFGSLADRFGVSWMVNVDDGRNG